nr:UvrD-helicase domain-containing protein [Halobellus litoreus]
MTVSQLIWDLKKAPREYALNEYETVIDSVLEIESNILDKNTFHTSQSGHTTIRLTEERLTRIAESQFPASVEPQDQYKALQEYILAIETAVADEKNILTQIERILSGPEASSLEEEEVTDLRSARTLLRHSVEVGEKRHQRLESQRQTTISTLEKEIADWEQSHDELKQQSTPYLEVEQYLADDNLLTQLKQLRDEIAATHQVSVDSQIQHPVAERSRSLQRALSELHEDLKQSRVQYARKQFEHTYEAVDEGIAELHQQLTPARSNGKKLTDVQELRDQIETLRQSIKNFQQAVYSDQIKTHRLNTLLRHTTQLDEFEAFIEAKTTFDKLFDECLAAFQTLKTDAAPYLNYRQYLTESVYSRLCTQTELIKRDLTDLRQQVDFSLLADADIQRVDTLEQGIQTIQSELRPSEYNPEFVERERKRCADLFSAIGDTELDLTPEQQKAVIRNGTYNQVIAAAGTGKTLTLTTRVAYLIQHQSVDPTEILVLAYTKEAADEMRTRLQDQFGITAVPVKTIHSFGYGLIQESQDGFVESIDPNEQRNVVDRQISQARKQDTSSEFLEHYYEFLVHFDDVYYDEADFDTREEYVDARQKQTYVTLRGTEVKSRAEKLIADFLYTHQVEYRYEDRATWADSDPEKAGYTPDFYLPQYDLYIEHWGVDESGSVAAWFSQSSAEYREKIAWARTQFTDTDYTLVGTYEFEHEADRLKQGLRHRLTNHGVKLDRLDFEELVDSAFEYNHREGWIKTRFVNFIENAKRFEFTPSEIETQLSEANPRQYHFGHCGIHLLQEYARYLTRNGLVDFQDMVHDAVDTIQQDPESYTDRYEHLLVDEFQDIGKGKLDLIQELTGTDGAKLFAVGDDWQSIYSFQGAVVEYFTDFAEYFDDPIRTDLTTNFRSPSTAVTAGNALIENNSTQLTKTVRSAVDRETTPSVHVLRGYQFYDYVRRVRKYTVDLVAEYLADGAAPDDIMILCRYDDAVPHLTEIKDGLQAQQIPYIGKSDQYHGPDNNEDGVAVYSLYQAKGREADHIILVHAAEGPYGFPSNRRQGELLSPVQPITVGGIEEERRAFYVAVTRSKRTLDILTRGDHQSRFLDEIDDYTETVDAGHVEPLDEVGKSMTVTARVKQLLDPFTKQHQRGILSDRYGGSARFVSWASDDPPTLERGQWYRLSNLKVSEFKDEKELVWNTRSSLQAISDVSTLDDVPEREQPDNP